MNTARGVIVDFTFAARLLLREPEAQERRELFESFDWSLLLLQLPETSALRASYFFFDHLHCTSMSAAIMDGVKASAANNVGGSKQHSKGSLDGARKQAMSPVDGQNR